MKWEEIENKDKVLANYANHSAEDYFVSKTDTSVIVRYCPVAMGPPWKNGQDGSEVLLEVPLSVMPLRRLDAEGAAPGMV